MHGMSSCDSDHRAARSDADGRLQVEVAELKRTLHQAETEKKHARAQVDTLQSKLAASCSENCKLRYESQLIVTDLKRWITEQKHLHEKNDTLKAEVTRLKEVAAGQEKVMGSIKAQLKELCALQDEKILDKQTCVALNLGGLADMQTKLQRSLVNQQLNARREENKHLRRQLEEERGTCTQVPPPSPSLPVPTQHCISSPPSLPPCSSSQPETSDKGHRGDQKPKENSVR
ncbi:uncharacterized protein LOC109515552 [Hippocampus comes]|uniref:uncharacterized protein LOC109515552 n=1 Tax=Hippocampus comes TaxID=109280 RepID=UPI00094EBD33|nr:PREDICTED: uncharacterized protein LOC109515552 [Hippocampus comes]